MRFFAGTREKSMSSRLLELFFLAGAFAGCSNAMADCVGGGGTVVLNLPATVTVPRDAPVGTILTPWVTTAAGSNQYTCDIPPLTSMGYRNGLGDFTNSTGMTATSSDGTFTVYRTSVPGVGIAIGANFYYGSWGNCQGVGIGWRGWGNPRVGGSAASCSGTNVEVQSNYDSRATVALVKTDQVSVGGTVSGRILYYSWESPYGVGNPTNYHISSVQIVPALCTTPDVSVDLGTYQKSQFTGVGYTTRAVDFNVRMDACPAGMSAIQYKVDPVTPVINSTQSVVSLSSDSTAAGIGVQVLNGAGTTAFPFGTFQTFSNYKTATGGNYLIPMKARFYQTAATVTPGTARSAITLTMLYL